MTLSTICPLICLSGFFEILFYFILQSLLQIQVGGSLILIMLHCRSSRAWKWCSFLTHSNSFWHHNIDIWELYDKQCQWCTWETCLLLSLVSAPRSLPAKSMKEILPTINASSVSPCILAALRFSVNCRMQWLREESALAPVQPVLLDAELMSSHSLIAGTCMPTALTYVQWCPCCRIFGVWRSRLEMRGLCSLHARDLRNRGTVAQWNHAFALQQTCNVFWFGLSITMVEVALSCKSGKWGEENASLWYLIRQQYTGIRFLPGQWRKDDDSYGLDYLKTSRFTTLIKTCSRFIMIAAGDTPLSLQTIKSIDQSILQA